MFQANPKKRGLFGSQMPQGSPPIYAPQQPEMPAGMGYQQYDQPQRQGLGTKLFGQGWEQKALAIGGALRDDDNGRSAQAYFGGIQQEQAARDAAEKAAQLAAAQRQASLEDWRYKEEYQRANPKPVNNDTVNDVNWFMNATPEEKAAYREMNPEYRQGADGSFYRIDTGGAAPSAAPRAPVGKLTPIGGSASQAQGGFQ